MDERTTRAEKRQQPPPTGQESSAIRFPLPPEGQGAWRHWRTLLPAAWRRRVVIQGRRYWQPG